MEYNTRQTVRGAEEEEVVAVVVAEKKDEERDGREGNGSEKDGEGR